MGRLPAERPISLTIPRVSLGNISSTADKLVR
jgi:hypothetical protein